MQGNGQIVLVQTPKGLKRKLGLPACIDKDQGRAGGLYGLIDLGHGVLSGVSGPWYALAR